MSTPPTRVPSQREGGRDGDRPFRAFCLRCLHTDSSQSGSDDVVIRAHPDAHSPPRMIFLTLDWGASVGHIERKMFY
jgi:hypothetical protein